MSKKNWEKVEIIIDRVLNLPAEERTHFIDEQCSGDDALKSEVTLLLESIFDSEGWLDNPDEYQALIGKDIADDIEQLAIADSLIGQTVGSYTIKQELGKGGMGTVYLAERSDGAFEHQVAIKVIHQHKATKENILRFEQERRILAGLNHPGIAKLFDGGITGDGFPYLVMEYIDGMSITQYCEYHNFALEARLTLFKKILKAVRHAHENAIIHRDLKPSNILVTKEGEIKVLDFGISKMLDVDSSTHLTQTNARLLTPRYAAPEQIKQQPVTTATDLYALGILFYQLLCEDHPFDLEGLSQYEIEQVILKREPVSPSSKVSGSSLVTKKQLQGDLDAIALKAIRKVPARRYRVTNQFLDDLNNYQKGLPVSAHADSFKYRAHKLFQRYNVAIGTVAGILLLIIGLVGFYTVRITEERNQAQLEAEKAEQVSEFLMSLFEANNPNYTKGQTITAEMLLKTGAKRAKKLNTHPAVQAKMLGIIGEITFGLGKYEKADSLFQRAIKLYSNQSDQKALLAQQNNLANLYMKQGKLDQADSLLSVVLNRSQQNELDELSVIALNDLGNLAHKQSDFSKAERLHREALALRYDLYGNIHKSVAASLNNIGLALYSQGKLEEAKHFYQRALEMDKKVYGLLHTETALTMRNLGQLYREMEKYKRADSILTEVIRIDRLLLDNNHPRISKDLNELAVLHAKTGNYSKADLLFREILKIQRSTLNSAHPRIALTLNNLAWIAIRRNKFNVAEGLYRDALHIAKRSLGSDHINTALFTHNLATTLHEQHKYHEGEKLYRKALFTLRKNLPENHYKISHPLIDLGKLLIETNRFKEALPILKEGLNIRALHYGDEHTETIEAKMALGRCFIELEEYSKAEKHLIESLEENKKARDLLTDLYSKWGKTKLEAKSRTGLKH